MRHFSSRAQKFNEQKGAAGCFYLGPGESHRGGSHHQQGPLIPVVGCYTDGLHSLPQAHIISQKEAALFGHRKTTGKRRNIKMKVCSSHTDPTLQIYTPPNANKVGMLCET